jgi:hypothetical protein
MRRDFVAAVVIAVLLVAGTTIFLRSGPSNSGSTVSSSMVVSSETGSQTANVANSDSLEFTMGLNPSNLAPGGSLTVSLNLYNTLDGSNNVTGSNDWQVTNQSEDSPGMNCAQNDPFRTEVLQGYYDLANFSKGTPVDFTVFQPPFGYNQCLFFIDYGPLFSTISNNYYIFEPMSSQARWVATGPQTANQSVMMAETVLIKPSLFTNSTGVFTVVSGDEWRDVQVAHFDIEPQTAEAST